MRGCRPLTPDEINRTLAVFDGPTATWERAIFITGLRTGMRISSILALRIEDVAHEEKARNRMWVRRATVKGKRSGYDMALYYTEVGAVLAKAGIVGGRGELEMHTTRKTYAERVFAALDHDLVRTAYASRGKVGRSHEASPALSGHC